MSGIHPDGGVTAANTSNTVVVPTTCTTSLFYSVSRCSPRFDPAAMNALMSEVLSVMDAAGHTYDCAVLTNLATAIQSLTGIQLAVVGQAVADGAIVQSADGDVYWNCTGADVTPADVTTAGLVALGLCPMHTTVSVAAVGQAVAVGSMVQSTDGDLYWNCTGATVTPIDATTAGLVALGFCPLHAAISDAAVGVVVPAGDMVQSTDGDVYWNCTGAVATLVNATTAGLVALGFCPISSTPSFYMSSNGIPTGAIPLGSLYVDDAGTGSQFIRTNDGANDVWVQFSA